MNAQEANRKTLAAVVAHKERAALDLLTSLNILEQIDGAAGAGRFGVKVNVPQDKTWDTIGALHLLGYGAVREVSIWHGRDGILVSW